MTTCAAQEQRDLANDPSETAGDANLTAKESAMPLFDHRPADQPTSDVEREGIMADPGFGQHFTDHMATARWTPDGGWRDHHVHGLTPFNFHPGTAVLHYAQEILEGMKAYRHEDRSVWLFRPELNARRFNSSAERMALPTLDEATFIEGVEAVIAADERWVPEYGGEASLYVRPSMLASETFLGMRPSAEVTFSVIASPAGAYFKAGPAGVRIWVSDTYTRAAEGGTGAAKCGGNYAAGLAALIEAQEQGCDQALYLGGEGRRWIDECGTANFFAVTADGTLVTPALGTILDGITRDSVLRLAGDHDLIPVERRFGIDELIDGCRDGSVTEAFAAGTAAVVAPIIAFRGEGYEVAVGDGRPGKRTLAIRAHILDIQYGRVPDDHGWMRRVLS